jgi:hypothetical protein
MTGPMGSGEPDAVGVRQLGRVCAQLREARDDLRERPWEEVADRLGRVGARFLDARDPLRIEALDRLPSEAALAPAMAEAVLDGMARDWTSERLRRTVRAEFEEPGCLDGFRHVRGRSLMALGPGLCLQVVSGSVPGVGVHALIRSLLVKAPTLLKPGWGDVLLPRLYHRGLLEEDDELGEALAVTYWTKGAMDVLDAALGFADVAVVYGSDTTVEAVRRGAPATTRVVGYHHRLGVALIGREVWVGGRAREAAAELARAVALFEQRGCVCPHLVYVEEGGDSQAASFAELLADALHALETRLPSAPLDPAERSALQQLRGTAEIAAALVGGWIRHGGGSEPWSVIFEPSSLAGPATLARGVRVRPVSDIRAAAAELEALGPHLQTIGHAGLDGRLEPVAAALARLGASRIVPLARMSFPPPWWLHDGRGPLRDLVRWAEIEPA